MSRNKKRPQYVIDMLNDVNAYLRFRNVKDESDLLLYAWTTVAGSAGNLACRPGDLSGLLLFGEKVGPPLAQREKASQQPAGLSLCLLGLPSCFSYRTRAWSDRLLGSPLGHPRLLCDFISTWQPGLAGI